MGNLTVNKSSGVSSELFNQVLSQTPEWLHSVKSSAWESFLNISNDKRYREKFRDVIESLDLENQSSTSTLSVPADFETRKNHWGDLSGDVSLTGDFELSEELTSKGVLFKSLKSALTENESLVKPYLLKSKLNSRDSRFSALAEALWTDGVLLYVPKDTEVKLPVYLLKNLSQGNSQNYYKTLVIVEAGSKLTLIDEYYSEKTQDFFLISGINELHVNDSAQVSYLHLQNFDQNAFNFSVQKAILGQNSSLKLLSVSLGGQFSYENIRAYMEKPGANAEILGLVIGDDEQVFQHETLQHHPKPSASSDLHFEVMLKSKAESSHNGFVEIEKSAQQTDAHQLIRNLLLSRKAKAEAIPNLEILADDVKCSHGVSLGPVSTEELFYLMSRGFSQEQSENLIIEGTIERVIAKLEDEEHQDLLREYILEALSRKGN